MREDRVSVGGKSEEKEREKMSHLSRSLHAAAYGCGNPRPRRLVAVLAVALLLSAATSIAQTYYGTIRGTVSDATGALAPGVEVTLTNIDTNISQKVVSNEAGNYVAPNLTPGAYRVSAEKGRIQEIPGRRRSTGGHRRPPRRCQAGGRSGHRVGDGERWGAVD